MMRFHEGVLPAERKILEYFRPRTFPPTIPKGFY
jgi:hypothetical protein